MSSSLTPSITLGVVISDAASPSGDVSGHTQIMPCLATVGSDVAQARLECAATPRVSWSAYSQHTQDALDEMGLH